MTAFIENSSQLLVTFTDQYMSQYGRMLSWRDHFYGRARFIPAGLLAALNGINLAKEWLFSWESAIQDAIRSEIEIGFEYRLSFHILRNVQPDNQNARRNGFSALYRRSGNRGSQI